MRGWGIRASSSAPEGHFPHQDVPRGTFFHSVPRGTPRFPTPNPTNQSLPASHGFRWSGVVVRPRLLRPSSTDIPTATPALPLSPQLSQRGTAALVMPNRRGWLRQQKKPPGRVPGGLLRRCAIEWWLVPGVPCSQAGQGTGSGTQTVVLAVLSRRVRTASARSPSRGPPALPLRWAWRPRRRAPGPCPPPCGT